MIGDGGGLPGGFPGGPPGGLAGAGSGLPDWVIDRRAIESLRSGVPNRDAVRALGCAQPAIEDRFRRQLEAVAEALPRGEQAEGLLVAGDFGSGKSHLLEYLRLIALDENFVCSKVVISKETPLYDPAKLYRAAIEGATVPGKRGSAMAEIAAGLDSRRREREYVDLYAWANATGSALNGRFPATLYLFERVAGDSEWRDRLIAFWSGTPIGASEIRRALRDHGATVTFKLDPIRPAELALQRFQFATRLMMAAGYAGWVLLIDEVELIGRYSSKQRARSYAELVRWAGRLPEGSIPGLATVLTITADFAPIVLQQRDDFEKIPGRLRAAGRPDDQMLASLAERGMRWIDRGAVRLRAPDRVAIEGTHEKVREIHGRAYHWDPPPAGQREVLGSTRMREYVRRWINEWDLSRLYPGYQAETEVREVRLDYRESPDLERSERDEGADEGSGMGDRGSGSGGD